jgi:hypothetical protein
MKKLLTIAFAMLLGATLSFAQATGGSTGSTDKAAGASTADTKTKTKGHSHKKGGKKGKKSSGGTTTPAPK